MKCIYCGYPESKVIDSRPLDDGTATRRRRECLKCQRRFTTYEKAEQMPVMVIKKDGRREEFNIDKIKRGLFKACEKRAIPLETIEQLARDVERQVYGNVAQEVPASEIGDMIMRGLKEIDEVAYVRFASVYRQFKDISTFMDELNRLLAEK